MEKIISCHVIEDLLPSYADGICSEESRALVDEHVMMCDSCKAKLERMMSERLEAESFEREDEDIISLTRKLQEREKKQKRTTGALGGLSAVLALCLVISVLPINRMVPGQQTGSGQVSESQSGQGVETETEESALIGVASEAELGDYKRAKNYGEVYDYVKSLYKKDRDGGWFGFGTGSMKEEESASVTDSVASGTGTMNGAAAPMEPMTGDLSGDRELADAEFSQTNIMTTGVDESDISKTDGKYIYNATGSEIIIFDITKGEAEKVADFMPDFESPSDIIREIYVDGDKMSVITEHEDFSKEDSRSETIVMIYDISDVQNTELLGSYRQDGSYKTSRKTEDIIYLFTEEWLRDPGQNKTAAIEDEVDSWFPTINDQRISSDCIYLPESGQNTLVISSFDQNTPGKTIDTKVIVNQYAQVYVGSDSIVLYSSAYASGRDITKISKLSYDKGRISTGASTSIRGNINDDFAINEYDGYLRIVSTEWSNSLTNTLYVFDKNLKECGRISNIANGESLYACRFMGEIGYFVTFEQTDPLFSVDLSDPYNPYLIGEIELPGFSEYLHFWGEDKLLGIGYEADNRGRRTGIKLSMFDIADPANMKEIAKEVIDGGDYSPGFYNYKAILCAPNVDVVGFSYVNYDENGTNSHYVIYSYDDETDTFSKEADNTMKNSQVERVRGHFRGEYLYISEDTKVDSVKFR